MTTAKAKKRAASAEKRTRAMSIARAPWSRYWGMESAGRGSRDAQSVAGER
jgi:hypothetical protein